LRECCIYSVLSEVAEVRNAIHFPGLTSGLAYCVMERLQGRLLSQHLQRIREGGKPLLQEIAFTVFQNLGT
jgi:hypothetical protein